MKQGEWKIFERKWKGKLFWSVFCWVERKENKWWVFGVFSLDLPKRFLPKIEKKWEKKKQSYLMDKCPCSLAHGLHPYIALFHIFSLPPGHCLLFFFFLFILFFSWTLPLLSFFFFSFDLPCRLRPVYVTHIYIYFLLLSFVFFFFFLFFVQM